MRRPHRRSRSRGWALQVLYAWEVSDSALPLTEFGSRCLARRRVRSDYRPYLERLLALLEERMEPVDRCLQRVMPNWRLERLTAIDRAILRIGAAEILFAGDVPPKVAITEAIALAERYGGEESPRFVNGVLDAVLREAEVEV